MTEPEPELDPLPLPGLAPQRSRAWPFFIELAVILAVVFIVVITTRTYVVEAYVIHGKSMEPTFHDSERLLISKFAPRFESLVRGDIIVFNHPDEPGKRLIKRIIGLPGDSVRMEDGRVFVNGELIPEPYLDETSRDGFHMRTIVIEAEHYFVLGDNRDISNDSRRMGSIPADAVIGKALVLFYPKFRVF
jgi:signal peptidase I